MLLCCANAEATARKKAAITPAIALKLTLGLNMKVRETSAGGRRL